MNIQYSKKKEELRSDPLIESLEKVKEFVKENGSRLLTGLVIVLLVFVGLQVVTYGKRAGIVRAQEAFGRAMIVYSNGEMDKAIEAFSQVIDNHEKSSHASYSAYMIGHIFMTQENYEKAISYFNKVLDRKKNLGFIRGQALEALATSYEITGDLNTSLDYFKKALEDKSIAYRYPAIKWKMALINEKLGNREKVLAYCNELISDTLAVSYKKRAENLLATM